MDQKAWLWRKRSSEKTIVAGDKAELTRKSNKEEVLPSEKELALESSAKYLNDKSASVICECNAEDDLVADHAKAAQEAIAAIVLLVLTESNIFCSAREKAEADVVFLRQELNEALQQRTAANERLVHLNAALRVCMQQLSSVREEQEQRIRDAVTETSKDYEKEHKKLKEKFTEASKRIANLIFESSRLSKALVVKDSLIEDLSKRSFRAEAEFSTLMARLDSTEKENAFLIYEFRMLEKELEIRNEEREYNRRSMDASHRQHLESAKKIAKLDAECQRLRTLVRKRLPGPAALANMKTEVGIQGRNQIEMRRKRTPTTGDLLVQDFTSKNPQIPSKKVGFLIEQLCDMEEENRILQEIIAKRDDELCSLQTTFSLTASRLSQVEAQVRELSTFQNPMEVATCKPVSNELSLVSSLNTANNDEIVPSGSWASTLISGLDHFRHGETKKASESTKLGVPDMSLMDDFVEMEKLAIVSVDAPPRSSCLSSDASRMLSDSLTRESCNHQSVLTGKELVPVVQGGSSDTEREHQRSDLLSGKTCDWLQDVQKVILEQSRVSKRSAYELLEDIRMALHYLSDPSSTHPEPSNLPPVGGYINWKSPTSFLREGSLTESSDTGNSKERTNNQGIGSVQAELETLKEANRIVEEQIENQKLINEDLDTQITMAKFRLNEVSQKLSSVEVELDDRIHCCEELEATCLELQLQLESAKDKEIPKDSVDKGKLLQNGSDMTAASAKLAECQETVFNLGKQLKALASPKEVAVSDQVLSTASTFTTTTNSKNSSQRSSLRDQMLAEDDVQAEDLQSPKTKEVISSVETKHAAPPTVYLGVKSGCQSAATGVLAIAPNKKRGGGSSLLRKLLRRKKGSSKKTPFSFAT
ncbi:hypothetical protein RJ640_016578 [Escallonia rubra]|uniref:Filament-like plant protein 7 n=1 Tax=Escallonia rubra TaxID=112253 RepID=A0AA88USG4_9ASTE|nr:hypothetical protein RJ640_016578 [Escallonia rubra]